MTAQTTPVGAPGTPDAPGGSAPAGAATAADSAAEAAAAPTGAAAESAAESTAAPGGPDSSSAASGSGRQPSPAGVSGRLDAAALTLLCAGGAELTATLYGSFFGAGTFAAQLAGAAVLGAGLAAFAASRRFHAMALTLIGLLGLLVCATAIVLIGTPRGELSGAAGVGARALFGGWASMLSVATPAASTPRLLMTPAVVTWAAAYTATVLAWRGRRSAVASGAVLVLADAIGLAVTANQPTTHYLQTAGLLAVLLVMVLIRARAPRPADDAVGRQSPPEPSSQEPAPGSADTDQKAAPAEAAGPAAPTEPATRRRKLALLLHVLLVLAIVAASAIGAWALPHAATDRRFDPRTLVPQRLQLDPVLNPLSEVAPQLAEQPAQPLLRFSAIGPAALTRIPVVYLDTFDGSSWSSSASYLVAGPALAAGPRTPDARADTETIRISGLTSQFLPAAGRPEHVDVQFPANESGALLGFDSASGSLVADTSTLEGIGYTLTGLIPDTGGLDGAAAGSGPAFAADLALPPGAGALVGSAQEITAGAATPYAKAEAIAARLKDLAYNAQGGPGQSYAAVQGLLDASSAQDRATGDALHASAFAVLARIVGLPTRIAVGYALSAPSAAGVAYTLTTADAAAWDQVYFAGYGWVDFDPTDRADTAPANYGAATSAPQPSVPPTQLDVVNVPSAEPSGVPGVRPGPASAKSLPVLLIAAAALLVCLVGGAVVLGAVGRRRRRAERRRGGPSQRAAGAWREAVDLLAAAGAILPRSLTIEQVAQTARTADPSTPAGRVLRAASATLDRLAPIAVRAVFARTQVGVDEADEAWQLTDRLRTDVRSAAGRIRLLRHRIRPLPAGRHHDSREHGHEYGHEYAREYSGEHSGVGHTREGSRR